MRKLLYNTISVIIYLPPKEDRNRGNLGKYPLDLWVMGTETVFLNIMVRKRNNSHPIS
jgi:hypothetical protein